MKNETLTVVKKNVRLETIVQQLCMYVIYFPDKEVGYWNI